MLNPLFQYGGSWERARQSLIDDLRGMTAAINARWAATFGTGNINIVAAGGTGVGTIPEHAVVVGRGTDPVAAVGPGAANTLLHGVTGGDPQFAPVVEGDLALTDLATANVTSTKHGFAPKSPADATKFLNGAATPDYTAVPATSLSGAAALTTGDDTNMSLTAGGTPATALLRAVSLTLAWIGTLARSRGGMGNTSSTAHGVLLGNGAAAVAVTAVGATNTVLHGNTGADPSFSAVVEADLGLTDVATANVSTSAHGFAPKAPNDATKYLDGTGAYSTPAGGGGTSAYAPGTTSIADAHFLVMSNHLILTSTQRMTAAGSARIRLTT